MLVMVAGGFGGYFGGDGGSGDGSGRGISCGGESIQVRRRYSIFQTCDLWRS